MKLIAVIGKAQGTMDDTDLGEIQAFAEDAGIPSQYHTNVKGFNTKGKRIPKARETEDGRNMYVEISGPFFRDITAFQRRLLSIHAKVEGAHQYRILDSQITQEEYVTSNFKYENSEDRGLNPNVTIADDEIYSDEENLRVED